MGQQAKLATLQPLWGCLGVRFVPIQMFIGVSILLYIDNIFMAKRAAIKKRGSRRGKASRVSRRKYVVQNRVTRRSRNRAPKIVYVQVPPPAPPAPPAAPPAQGNITWGDAGKLLAVNVGADVVGHEVIEGLDDQ
jgi:hypothetical protein